MIGGDGGDMMYGGNGADTSRGGPAVDICGSPQGNCEGPLQSCPL